MIPGTALSSFSTSFDRSLIVSVSLPFILIDTGLLLPPDEDDSATFKSTPDIFLPNLRISLASSLWLFLRSPLGTRLMKI